MTTSKHGSVTKRRYQLWLNRKFIFEFPTTCSCWSILERITQFHSCCLLLGVTAVLFFSTPSPTVENYFIVGDNCTNYRPGHQEGPLAARLVRIEQCLSRRVWARRVGGRPACRPHRETQRQIDWSLSWDEVLAAGAASWLTVWPPGNEDWALGRHRSK